MRITKICVECEHYREANIEPEFSVLPTCKNNPRIDLVSGEVKYYECHIARSDSTLCGTVGLKFTPKADFWLKYETAELPEKPF